MLRGFGVPLSGSWATPEAMTSVATRAEELGYASLWTFQRLLSPLDGDRPILPAQYRTVDDPIAVMAYLAAITRRCRLGVAVLNLPFAAPVLLAKQLTTIDRLSGGRLDVGLGTGWMAQEFDAVGVSIERRGARADDFLGCLHAIWTQDVVEYDGPFYRVPRSRIDPKPVQGPHPPVLLGGGAPAALRRAGRLADGWISSSQQDLSRIDEAIAVVRGAAADAGRDPKAVRIVCRGVVKVRDGERGPLTGSLDEIRSDLEALATKGVDEVFVDLNFDPTIASDDADPEASLAHVHRVLEALAP